VTLEGQKSRLIMMLAVNVACFVLAAAAIVGAVSFGVKWLLPVFVACIGAGIGAQVWFIVGWARMSKGSGRAQA
jgi:hypothetical protein